MHRIRWYGPTVVLLVVMLLVMVAGPGVMRRLAHIHQATSIQLVRDELKNNGTLAEMSQSFREVAKVVEPSVVSIEVLRRNPVTRGPSGMSEDMMRRFFGPNFRFWQGEEEAQPEAPRDSENDRYNRPQTVGNGSGWVVDQQGHIITNHHVVADADVIKVRFHNESEREAKLVGSDPRTDVAVLKVEDENLIPAARASEGVEQGDIVFAFGSPFNFEFSMSQGIVSATGRKNLNILRGGYENFIQTDAAINPGNSGGPLTNIRGEVVGMNTAIATRTGSFNGLGFAIPVDMVMEVAQQIINKGRVTRGYLGVLIRDLEPRMARTYGYDGKGVLVEDMLPDGPAKEAGLEPDDIITKVDGQAVSSADELRNRVARITPGTKAELEIFRAGETQNLTITVAELPEQMSLAGGPSGDRPAQTPREAVGLASMRKLGIEGVETFTRALAQRLDIDFTAGVLVTDIRPQSIAASEGLSRGNLIIAVQGDSVRTVEELSAAIEKLDLQTGVRLTVLDNNRRRSVFLELPKE